MVGGGGGGEIAGCGWSSRAILRPSCASRSVASRSRVATRRARRAARASDMDTATRTYVNADDRDLVDGVVDEIGV